MRLDYAADSWNGPPEDAIGHWRVQVPFPKQAHLVRIDPDALMRYFEQLSEEASPSQEPQRYVMALLLLKQKRLQLVDALPDDEGDILRLEGLHGEGVFEVRNLALPDVDLNQLQDALKTQLAAGWT